MTERTLEMLKITDEGDAAESDAAEGSEAEASEAEGLDEPVSEPGETPHTEDEVTDVRRKGNVKGSADVAEADEELADESSVPDPVSGKKRLGRHDLPEELFATNEISAPEVREKLEKMDELGELSDPSESSETTNKKAVEKNGEAWNPRLQEDSGVDEAWDEIADSVSPGAEASSPDEADSFDDEDDLEEIDDLEGIDDDDDDDFEGEDTGEPRIDPRDFVSDGYKMPLPFKVGPTPDDVRRGLKVSRASRARKDRIYPVPEPKKLDEIHRRVFDLTPVPPRDQTGVIVAVVVIFIALIVSLVSC